MSAELREKFETLWNRLRRNQPSSSVPSAWTIEKRWAYWVWREVESERDTALAVRTEAIVRLVPVQDDGHEFGCSVHNDVHASGKPKPAPKPCDCLVGKIRSLSTMPRGISEASR